jgi:hypothetical protein
VNPVTSSDLHSFYLVIVKQHGIMTGNMHHPFDGEKKGVRRFEQKTEVLPLAGVGYVQPTHQQAIPLTAP